MGDHCKERTSVVPEAMGALHASARAVAREIGINMGSVLKNLHKEGLNPYQIQLRQATTEDVKIKRLDFAKWVL